ncbi:MAG: nicotinamide-nucleotide amidohydrolase family protein [Alphaproteobacteria bacterium]|nr:nicotinamide-nucleotide amidohydrolase family protein [Alphaproteobacteria bacterium]
MNNENLKELIAELKRRNLKVATAESLTCGLIGATLTSVSGASAVVRGGYLVYCDEMKNAALDVPKEMLEQFTAVSEPVARAMALGALRKTPGADIAVAVTGYAGSTGGLAPDADKGLVYIGIACNFNVVSGEKQENVSVSEHRFPGEREDVRNETVNQAIAKIQDLLALKM